MQNGELRTGPRATQKTLVPFSIHASIPPGSLWRLPWGLRHMSSLTCHHFSLPALLIAFYQSSDSPVAIAKMVKLSLEPLAIFILLSRRWSRRIHVGLKLREGEEKQHQGQQTPRRLVLVDPRPPPEKGSPRCYSPYNDHWPLWCRSPRHQHFVPGPWGLLISAV